MSEPFNVSGSESSASWNTNTPDLEVDIFFIDLEVDTSLVPFSIFGFYFNSHSRWGRRRARGLKIGPTETNNKFN